MDTALKPHWRVKSSSDIDRNTLTVDNSDETDITENREIVTNQSNDEIGSPVDDKIIKKYFKLYDNERIKNINLKKQLEENKKIISDLKETTSKDEVNKQSDKNMNNLVMLLELERSNVNELTKALVIEQDLRMEEVCKREADQEEMKIVLHDKNLLEEQVLKQSEEIKNLAKENIELIKIINNKNEINQKLEIKLQEYETDISKLENLTDHLRFRLSQVDEESTTFKTRNMQLENIINKSKNNRNINSINNNIINSGDDNLGGISMLSLLTEESKHHKLSMKQNRRGNKAVAVKLKPINYI